MDVDVEKMVLKVKINNLELNSTEAKMLYDGLANELVALQTLTAKKNSNTDAGTVAPNLINLLHELEEQGVG